MLATRLEQLLTQASESKQFSGVVCVQRGNDILFQGAYGYANRRWRIPNGLETCFRIASIGKMFTAVAFAQQIDRGTLSLIC